MAINVKLDISSLSKREKLNILREIIKSEPSIKEDIIKFDTAIDVLPDSKIESMVLDDFKKYEEIFKALA